MSEVCRRLANAITKMKESKAIHEGYIETPWKPEYTGTVEWHKMWVNIYKDVIDLLEQYSKEKGCE